MTIHNTPNYNNATLLQNTTQKTKAGQHKPQIDWLSIFRLSAYMMKIISETGHAHQIRYYTFIVKPVYVGVLKSNLCTLVFNSQTCVRWGFIVKPVYVGDL